MGLKSLRANRESYAEPPKLEVMDGCPRFRPSVPGPKTTGRSPTIALELSVKLKVLSAVKPSR
jgi:hypothetical protein